MSSSAGSHPPRHGTGCSLGFGEELTDTLPGVSGEAGAVVALQSSLPVAGKHLGAGLASLPGAHLAAPAAVQDQGDS